MIDSKTIFSQPIKRNKITYESIKKTATGQWDDYTTGCLLDIIISKNIYKMDAIDLSKNRF